MLSHEPRVASLGAATSKFLGFMKQLFNLKHLKVIVLNLDSALQSPQIQVRLTGIFSLNLFTSRQI